ncbi:MAG: AAA family ATPase [Ruminococcaceae bacterium]|nr:AAA family ATPase [Oscillospiraceae bacterium]
MFQNIIYDCDYVNFFEEQIETFGGISRGIKKYVLRKNINTPFPDKGAYFGCINDGEDLSGAYSDLSIVIFPSNEQNNEDDRWIIALGVGSLGFKNDYSLVSLPGTRRLFMKYLKEGTYIKNDFIDLESSDGFTSFCNENTITDSLDNAVKNYGKVLLTATLFNPNNYDTGKELITKYLALYATLRHWPSNNTQRAAVKSALNVNYPNVDDEQNVRNLILNRKYVVLQGAPGTGKTRLAKRIPSENDIVFFTQFHAETTYSDFIYGITPDVNERKLNYSAKEGVFAKAIRESLKTENQDKKVFLIIDEINRANLSNVLGPSFYLFEPTMTGHNVKIEVCPGLELEKLPDNLYVIATMNTADRSLAVVDFALRRRFSWYTLFPHEITPEDGQIFCREDFNAIADIFERYASDEELNLQPGHAYFIIPASNQNEIDNRLKYEIMPLIKEYLLDGMLSRAKDDFINYFRKRINEEMFQ